MAKTNMLLQHPKFYEARALLIELADALDVDLRIQLMANHGQPVKTVEARA